MKFKIIYRSQSNIDSGIDGAEAYPDARRIAQRARRKVQGAKLQMQDA